MSADASLAGVLGTAMEELQGLMAEGSAAGLMAQESTAAAVLMAQGSAAGLTVSQVVGKVDSLSLSAAGSGGFCLSSTSRRTHLLHVAVVVFPTLSFFLYLCSKLRSSLRKLSFTRSHIMSTYYILLWVVSFFSAIHCIVQISRMDVMKHQTFWNFLWLMITGGVTLLEVSVLVFLSQGYFVSGSEALMRTLFYSGIFAATDMIIKIIYIMAFKVPLFLETAEDLRDWEKWLFWMCRSLLFLAVYLLILVLPYTRWQERLPARPAFYRYVFVLFVWNFLQCLGTILVGSGADFGFCVYGLTSFAYYALYPPLLYVTFLAEFFRGDDFLIDDMYYSEMNEAGYFDADWE